MDTNRTDADVQTYDGDYYGWTQQQAAYLRNGRMDRVDLENVAEEIESLGKSQLHALTSRRGGGDRTAAGGISGRAAVRRG